MAGMLRALVLLLAAGSLPAQASGDAVLYLRDGARNPLAGAEGQFRLERATELPALRGLALTGTQLANRELHAHSDAQGTMRLANEEALAMSGVVRTGAGLGALVLRLRPGEGRRLALQPMGEVTTPEGSEPFILWARASLPTGERLTLPPATGTAVRLPAGSYEAWAKNADGFTWQRLLVQPGQRTMLRFTGPAQRVRAPEGARMQPAGWPEIELLAAGRETTLLATALAAPFVTFVDGRSDGERVLPGPWSTQPLAWPPPADDAPPPTEISLGTAAPDQATLLSLRQEAAGGWQVLAVSHARAGRCLLPLPPAGDTWLLLLARDRAPHAVAWSAAAAPRQLVGPGGQPLVARCRDEKGLPVADVALEYVPDDMPPALVAAPSDGRGEARFGIVQGPGTLRVSDPRFANQTIELGTIPGEAVAITITQGSELRGVVTWTDGKPAAGIVVTVRDASGLLRPAQRAVVSDEHGAFAFGGLRDNRSVVLFASTQRDGHTWSAKLDRLFAGGEDVALTLRDEDPVLIPPNGR